MSLITKTTTSVATAIMSGVNSLTNTTGSTVNKVIPKSLHPYTLDPIARTLHRLNHSLVRSEAYQDATKKEVNQLTDKLSDEQLHDSGASYRSYINAQIQESFSITKSKSSNLRPAVKVLSEEIKKIIAVESSAHILCVGCRYQNELDYIEQTCNATTVGLDLFSTDPRITVGDMHQMPFKTNSFDGIYASHSLEHAFDIQKVISEYLRVLNDNGFVALEVPTRFEPSETDRFDLISTSNILEYFHPYVNQVHFKEDAPINPQTNRSRARLVFSIAKSVEQSSIKSSAREHAVAR